MEIAVRLLPGVDVLALSGQAKAGSHLSLRETFLDSVEQGRMKFIINLNEASYIDSMMIGEMVACFKRARERGGDVKLVVASQGIVHELIQLTGLDHAFQVYGDELEAAASFANPPS